MKKIKWLLVLCSIIICMFTFSYNVCADNIDVQSSMNTVTAEEFNSKISDIEKRLSEVEKLSENEIISSFLQNENQKWNNIGITFTILSCLIAAATLFGTIIPLISRKEVEKDFSKIEQEWKKRETEINKKINELTSYQMFNNLKHFRDDEKIEVLNECIKLNPNYAAAYSARGELYLGKRQYKRAIDDCTKVIELAANVDDVYQIIAYKNRAIAYSESDKIQEALNDIDTVLMIAPDDEDAKNRKKKFLEKQKK